MQAKAADSKMTTSTAKHDDPAIASALSRWCDALNSRGPAPIADAVAASCAPTVTIARCGWDADAGTVVQLLQGREAVAGWLALTAAVVRFSIDWPSLGRSGPRGDWQIRYTVSAPDGFRGGGTWTLALDEAGLLLRLRHQPDGLAAPHRGDDAVCADHRRGSGEPS